MKKKYEKNQLLIITILLFLLLELGITITFFKMTFRTFKVIPGVVVTDNYIKVYISKNTLSDFRNTKYLYIENHKKYFEIINITKNVMHKKGIWYHEILIRIKIPKKYNDTDIINLTIYSKKIAIYKMFKSCWKED